MRFDAVWRLVAVTTMLALALALTTTGRAATPVLGQDERHGEDRGEDHAPTPHHGEHRAVTAAVSCDAAATPAAGHAHGSGTPGAGMDMGMEFDQLYIDMMIPHHQSILALAEAALPRLSDERLQAIAEAIIAAQTPEIEELRGYRDDFYGSPDPMPMDGHTMDMTMQAMPGMGSMEEMAFQMDAEAQVAAFCGADDPDLAFVDLVIPHHEMAIAASEAALQQATHEEIRDVAQRVIDAQQREIDELTAIRLDLTGPATPEAAG